MECRKIKKCLKWAKEYCDNEKNFKDPKCKHLKTADYYSMGLAKITHVRVVCTHCGKLSQWARTYKHTADGGFKYKVVF